PPEPSPGLRGLTSPSRPCVSCAEAAAQCFTTCFALLHPRPLKHDARKFRTESQLASRQTSMLDMAELAYLDS
ncbi:unnamed protein product, partial [Callosobruchus maculatus]